MTLIPPALAAPALARPSQNAVRYQVPVTATADAGGNATFDFPDAPQGQWIVGSVTIANAPANASFVASVGIQPWGVWNGPAPSPAIQVDGRTHCEVVADFLTPLASFTAWFIGWSDEIDSLLFPQESLSATQQSVTLLSANQSAPAGVVTIPISSVPTPWLQTLVIRVLAVSGTSNGLLLTVTDPSVASFRTDFFASSLPFQYEQFVYVPVGGRPSSIQIQAMVNGSPVATAQTFFVEVLGSQSFVPYVMVGSLPINFGQPGQQRDGNIAGGTVNAAYIAAPPTGMVLVVRNLSAIIGATAPAAPGDLILRGSISGIVYARLRFAVGNQQSFWANAFYVYASGNNDPAEGLTISNNTNQIILATCNFDIVPAPPIGPTTL